MAQRARRDRERFERSPTLPRFFSSLTPSRRQRAQIERAKAKKSLIQSDVMLQEFNVRPMTNILGTSDTTNLLFSCETCVPPEF